LIASIPTITLIVAELQLVKKILAKIAENRICHDKDFSLHDADDDTGKDLTDHYLTHLHGKLSFAPRDRVYGAAVECCAEYVCNLELEINRSNHITIDCFQLQAVRGADRTPLCRCYNDVRQEEKRIANRRGL